MRKYYFLKLLFVLFIAFGLSVSTIKAQQNPNKGPFDIKIEQCESDQEVIDLVKDVFLDGVSPSQYRDVEFTGDFRSVGYFYSGYIMGFGTPEGIVMSNGFAGNLAQSNDCSPANANNGTNGGSDSDLALLTSLSINDACIIEFDFKPSGDSAKFNFVFGSEEYHDYVNTSFNDVFGFFLSGYGISGPHTNNGINIAIVPGTSQPVTINNVNCGRETSGCNPPPGSGPNCDQLKDNKDQTKPAFGQFALDAYTYSFVADNEVTPCKWYHIKLAIGDAGDGAYDSGVFLERGSFDPGAVIKDTEFTHPTIDTLLYESCNNHEAVVYFTIGSTRASDYKIPFVVEGTATRGTDYDILQGFHQGPGDTIVIPTGKLYDSLRIKTYYDTDIEGTEDVQIIFNSVMCGFGVRDTAIVKIADLPLMVDTTMTFYATCEETITIDFLQNYGGVNPYIYDWYTIHESTTTVQFTPSGDDYYEVPCLIKDTCGQQSIGTAIVIVPDLIADAGLDKSMCNQDSVTIDGSSSGAQHFLWVPNPADPSLNGKETQDTAWVYPSVATEYRLEVSDNCTNNDMDTVYVSLSEAVADAGDDENICIQESVTLTANGDPGYKWEWSAVPTDGTLVGQEGNQSITVTPLTTTVYSVIVTNDCDFSATDQVEVVVTPLPNADAGSDDDICFGESFQLNASGSVHYQWTSVPNDPSLSVNGQDTTANPIVTPPTQESYKYYVVVWDQCFNNDSMTLVVNPIPSISLTPADDILCFGEETTITAGGTVDDYTWTSDPFDPDLAAQQGNQVITVSPVGTTTYTLTGTAAGIDCPASLSQTITVKELLLSDFNVQEDITCQGETFSVMYTGNATSAGTYTWDFDGADILNGSDQGPIDISWDSKGDKVIVLTVSEDGCGSDPVTKTVKVVPTPVSGFVGDLLEDCAPLTVKFTDNSDSLTSDATYFWTFGNGEESTQSSPSYTYSEPGVYDISLTVTNSGRCFNKHEENAYITVFENPQADFVASPTEAVLENAKIDFTDGSTSGDPISYLWDFGDTKTSDEKDPSHTYTAAGVYSVLLIVTTSNGCENEILKEVTIHPDFSVYAPNAFTPNGDGLNDFFEVKGLGIKTYLLQVYSRWGDLMYESNNLEDQWDGKFNGKLVPVGTYVYVANYRSMIDKDYTKEGTVTVQY